ncbi:hypothetical protein [Micromonospora wenchangensis]|uniref:hypothetical protein n=1 Tax=Micromonospora wenchangensis TaxID=1185415 RepID=UPI00342ECC8A
MPIQRDKWALGLLTSAIFAAALACLAWAVVHVGQPAPLHPVYPLMGVALMALGAVLPAPLPSRMPVRITLTPTACLVCASALPVSFPRFDGAEFHKNGGSSRMAFWRLYLLSGTRTPLSMTIGCPGPPPNARTFPVRSQPSEVLDVGARLSLDLASLVAEMRSPIGPGAAKG